MRAATTSSGSQSAPAGANGADPGAPGAGGLTSTGGAGRAVPPRDVPPGLGAPPPRGVALVVPGGAATCAGREVATGAAGISGAGAGVEVVGLAEALWTAGAAADDDPWRCTGEPRSHWLPPTVLDELSRRQAASSRMVPRSAGVAAATRPATTSARVPAPRPVATRRATSCRLRVPARLEAGAVDG